MSDVPTLGPYWQDARPDPKLRLDTMRQGGTIEFDNVFLRTPGAFLARPGIGDRILPELEHTLEDSTIGQPNRTEIEFRGKTYRATSGSVEFAAMASVVWPYLSQPSDILEIGGGYGGLARAFLMGGKARTYTIVNLPEVGRCARYFLAEYPNVRVLAPAEFAADEKRYDLAIQTRGFMEMSLDEVAFYFDALQTGAVKVGGLFFTINRRSKVTKFEDYPFDYGWEELVDGTWPEGTGMVMKLLRRTERMDT